MYTVEFNARFDLISMTFRSNSPIQSYTLHRLCSLKTIGKTIVYDFLIATMGIASFLIDEWIPQIYWVTREETRLTSTSRA